MDFEFAAEHESFRKEFRDWLATNLPPDLCLDDAADDRVASDRETFERRRAWQRTMHAAGRVGITWPKEYGGHGAGPARAHGPQPRGSHPHPLGHRGAEAPPPSRDPRRRGDLVPGLLRA